ncbi:MAG: ABC transporter permease [Prevotella sp.]|jgi:lipoprotein-releasing system permease protein|nr:ABC transporter permease [Prevotella sp.]
MNLPLFLAKRFFSNNDEKRKISKPAIRIATAGVAIGLAVMIISVCVVLGFKHTIRDKVVGFGSHITVSDFMSIQSGEQFPICINDSIINLLKNTSGITHVQKYAMKQGILKTDNDFLGVVFKGVGPDFDTTFISSYMVEGSLPHFSDSTSSNKIVVSQMIANKLKLKVGDRIYSYFVGNNDDVRTRRFTIEGIYETNLKRFDESLCFTDFYTAVKLNGWEEDQASGAELTVSDFDLLNDIAMNIEEKIDHQIDHYGETYLSTTILKSYPQIFAWLNLLDLNIWIILALMMAVAGFTIISGLLIIILERTNTIGLLKAIGTRNSTIRKTFLWFSVFIVGKGLIIGNLIALAICLFQRYTGFFQLDANSYYVSTVPIEINPIIILLLNIATLLICILVLIAPSYLISHIHPAKSMRYE